MVKSSCVKIMVGAMLIAPVVSNADVIEQPFSFSIGLGKAKTKQSFDIAGLTSKGYLINSYKKNKDDDQSFSLGFSYQVSESFRLSTTLQSFGEVNSTLDADIPEGKTVEQAAAEIVDASPHQAGGLLLAFGGLYALPINSRLDLNIGAGALFGKDEHEVMINDEVVEVDDTLSAPYLKLGFGLKVVRGLTVTAHAERYFLDDAVERYEIGLSYRY